MPPSAEVMSMLRSAFVSIEKAREDYHKEIQFIGRYDPQRAIKLSAPVIKAHKKVLKYLESRTVESMRDEEVLAAIEALWDFYTDAGVPRPSQPRVS